MNDAERRDAILELAREKWQESGEIEIDDDAKLSEGNDNGTYVQAWVWVPFTGTELDKRTDDDE